MNRSAKDGEWSSPHYRGEGVWVPPRRTKVCAGDTVGKSVSNSGRPGIVQGAGMAGMRHSQTKGRATGKPGLEPPGGRCGYKRKRSSGRCGARSRIGARYSGTESEQGSGSSPASGDADRAQKAGRRGKAPCCVAASSVEERVSTWRKCGQVRRAKDPAPTSRRPGTRQETLEEEQSRRRKVHSLIDKVYAPANLAEAWKRVRENKGSAGIDGLTVTAFERPNTWPGCMPGYGTRPIGRPR